MGGGKVQHLELEGLILILLHLDTDQLLLLSGQKWPNGVTSPVLTLAASSLDEETD